MKVAAGCKADIQFLKRVVVDQIELNVFVSAALPDSGIPGTEQVQLSAFIDIHGWWVTCLRLRLAVWRSLLISLPSGEFGEGLLQSLAEVSPSQVPPCCSL